MLSEVSHKKINAVRFHLYEVSKIAKFIETEHRTVVTRAGGGRKGDLLFNGYRVSDLQDVRSSKDLFHNTVDILKSTEL